MFKGYSRERFLRASDEMGGKTRQEAHEVICDFGSHQLAIHFDMDPQEKGSAVLQNDDGTDWRGSREDVTSDGVQFTMRGAEGNPDSGRQMHVDDAKVDISSFGVRARRSVEL